jgi:hypothetical protein
LKDDQPLEFPEWFRIAGNEPLSSGGRGFVLEMFYRGKLVRAERARYEYFRPVIIASDAWFEGWSGKKEEPWVRLPPAPDPQNE